MRIPSLHRERRSIQKPWVLRTELKAGEKWSGKAASFARVFELTCHSCAAANAARPLKGSTNGPKGSASEHHTDATRGKTQMSDAERRERARLRSERWRRSHGIMPRRPAQKPWLAEGCSRSTWYRRCNRISDKIVEFEVRHRDEFAERQIRNCFAFEI